jgi:hypothetical protein
MGFILNDHALRSLANIRQEYEDDKKIKLNSKPSFLGMPTLLGGTNVGERGQQINFIEKMLLVLSENLIPEKEIINDQMHRTNLTASRMLLAVCLFVQRQITSNYAVRSGTNAALHQLINKKLGINDRNYLNAEDKAICFDTAHALLSIPGAWDDANKKLKEFKVSPISFEEWQNFKIAVIENLQLKTPKQKNNYPFTSITKPLFGAAFAYAGASLGLLGGDILNKSSQLLPTRYYISAGISGIALTMHTSNTLGVSILAPIVANRILESFFQVSLGHLGAVTFKVLGQGVGTVVGLPLDLAYHLSLKTYSTLKEMYSNHHEKQYLTGVRISDGLLVVNGLTIEIKECAATSKLEPVEQTRIEKDGSIFINGTLASAIVEEYLEDSSNTSDYEDSTDFRENETSELLPLIQMSF